MKNNSAAPDLRTKIIEAAGTLFASEGYEHVSMRRIAAMAGCSQMAMYRHFKDKDDLIRYLCAEAYGTFVAKVGRQLENLKEPRERILQLVRGTVGFAVEYPQHYRLGMMMQYPNIDAARLREPLAAEFLEGCRENLRACLPPGTPRARVETRLRQILACTHGMSLMLLSNPGTYGLTPKVAVAEVEAAVLALL
jgi:AcrR family transcriptional regulator